MKNAIVAPLWNSQQFLECREGRKAEQQQARRQSQPPPAPGLSTVVEGTEETSPLYTKPTGEENLQDLGNRL